MRCPECQVENDEGAAYCQACGMPFTAYAGQVTGVVSQEAVERAERMATRPLAVRVMVTLAALSALLWPIRAALVAVTQRARPNAEGTNYIGVAFGAVSTVAIVVAMGVVAAALGWLAWSAWTQRSWAWWGMLALLAIGVIATVAGLGGSWLLGLARLAVLGGLTAAWLNPRVREWYGT